MNPKKKEFILKMYRQLDELSVCLTNNFSELNHYTLTMQQEQILMLFKTKERWILSEISEKMKVSKSAISQVIKVLEQQGFVKREKNQLNLRESFIYLDEMGMEWSRMVDRIEDILAEKYFSVLEEADLKTVTNSFDAVIQEFKKGK